MIRMTALTNRAYGRDFSASEHRLEADRQLDDAIARIGFDSEASVRVEEDGENGAYWARVPTWSGADLSMARIVAEVALRHPGITVTSIESSDRKYPMERETGLVMNLWPSGHLCYAQGDRLSFRTGWDGGFPEHLRGNVSVTVGDDIRGALAALMPHLDALREWGERRTRERAAERAAKDAEREARIADGRALGEELARLILAEDPLSLAEAVNAAVKGMTKGGAAGATMAAARIAFMSEMTGMPPLAMGMRGDPRAWMRDAEGDSRHRARERDDRTAASAS